MVGQQCILTAIVHIEEFKTTVPYRAALLTEEFNTRVLAISGVSPWGKADVYEVFQKLISCLGFEKGRLVIEQCNRCFNSILKIIFLNEVLRQVILFSKKIEVLQHKKT